MTGLFASDGLHKNERSHCHVDATDFVAQDKGYLADICGTLDLGILAAVAMELSMTAGD